MVERLLPDGVTVGHFSDPVGRTGCTVLLCPAGGVAGVDVRGGAPGTFATDGLRPGTVVELAHGILLTGGSLFGLAAATGVMRYLEERGCGAVFGTVPIPGVVGAVLFDLLEGDPKARPTAENGYAACLAATADPAIGSVGAGTGATVAKAGDPSQRACGGVGVASGRVGKALVSAVMVANSVGGIWDDERHEWIAPLAGWDPSTDLRPGENTTIGVVATDAKLTKEQANRVATVAHDGIARAVRPAHTMYDGDTIFCIATGSVVASYDAIEVLATDLVARAIASGVRHANVR
ncbi:MAG TPA: P1 family peptidase [Mycobacterium sp.]